MLSLSSSNLTDALSSGLSISHRLSSSVDEPVSYYQTRRLMNSMSDISSWSNVLDQAQSVVNAADRGINNVQSRLSQAQSVAQQALSTDDASSRKKYAEQFDSILKQIDKVVADSSYGGANLLQQSSYTVQASSVKTTLRGADLSSSGMGVSAAGNDWASDSDIIASLTAVAGSSQAQDFVNSLAKSSGSSASPVSTGDYVAGAIAKTQNAVTLMNANNSAIQVRQMEVSSYASTVQQSASEFKSQPADEGGNASYLSQANQRLSEQSLSYAGQTTQLILNLIS